MYNQFKEEKMNFRSELIICNTHFYSMHV